ncbi:MAG: RagB/SusD family nutrient uptake outer membrane protein [Bacteroidia bacterium]|nr:RagB/SusD family nutrient uptake outer membrane protein [Bacteroidia bacterium]
MKPRYFKISAVVILLSVFFTACIKNLDTIPLDKDVFTSEKIYKDFSNYEKVIAKVYAGLATTGQKAPHGDQDILGLDEGASQYTRALFNVQEVVTDEAIIGWNDADLMDYNKMSWSSSNTYIGNMYYRIFYQVSLANEFLRQSTDTKLSNYGFTDEQKATIHDYRTEARWLRAFSYYHAIDLFGTVPFVTENDVVGSFLPKQITRTDLFDYIESELLAIENDLKAPRTNDYGRVDQASAWMLLAHLYLNAEVYGKPAKYTETITYAKKVIDAGYVLEDNYAKMFMADNHLAKGIIFAIPFDGVQTKTWGGTTYLVAAAIGGSMVPANFGTTQNWGGLRTRPEFVAKFPAGNTDKRKMFYTTGQSLSINDYLKFTDGYAIAKWTNMTSTGVKGSDGTHMDTDLPVYRLADAYLMYAEAVLRGGTGGSPAAALGYVNEIRTKAYGNATGNITPGQLTLPWILDERGRELYWECHRRTDLIRFGAFTGGTYLWQWKGGVQAGQATDAKYNLFPIPDSDLGANPNLEQNDPGY